MASLAVWQTGKVHKHLFSLHSVLKQQHRHHQSTWLSNVHRIPVCRFSKENGPMRYIPKHVRLPNEPALRKLSEQRSLDSEIPLLGLPENNELEESPLKTHVNKRTKQFQVQSANEQIDRLAVAMNTSDTNWSDNDEEENLVDGTIQGFQTLSSDVPTFESHASTASRNNAYDSLARHSFSTTDEHNLLLKAQQIKRSKQSGTQSLKKSVDRVSESINIDDSYWLEGDENIVSLEENTDSGTKSIGKLDSHGTAAREHAKNEAIKYLAKRSYTALELRKKLQGRGIVPELVDYAISVVQKCGLQSDLAYAETYARSRWNTGTWGPQRIRLALKQRGVSEDVIRVALGGVFSEDEVHEDSSVYNSTRMSKTAMEQLLVQATKKWNLAKNVNNDTRVRRIIQWLQYRGFNNQVIRTVLNSLLDKSSL